MPDLIDRLRAAGVPSDDAVAEICDGVDFAGDAPSARLLRAIAADIAAIASTVPHWPGKVKRRVLRCLLEERLGEVANGDGDVEIILPRGKGSADILVIVKRDVRGFVKFLAPEDG